MSKYYVQTALSSCPFKTHSPKGGCFTLSWMRPFRSCGPEAMQGAAFERLCLVPLFGGRIAFTFVLVGARRGSWADLIFCSKNCLGDDWFTKAKSNIYNPDSTPTRIRRVVSKCILYITIYGGPFHEVHVPCKCLNPSKPFLTGLALGWGHSKRFASACGSLWPILLFKVSGCLALCLMKAQKGEVP